MADENKSFNVTTGNITGTGIAVGKNVRASVTINEQTKKELTELLQQLRSEIQKAELPDGAKNVLLTKAVPEMEQAVHSPDPKSGFERALERINDQLQGAGAVANNVSGIVSTIVKIAKTIGTGISVVAPYLATLI